MSGIESVAPKRALEILELSKDSEEELKPIIKRRGEERDWVLIILPETDTEKIIPIF